MSLISVLFFFFLSTRLQKNELLHPEVEREKERVARIMVVGTFCKEKTHTDEMNGEET